MLTSYPLASELPRGFEVVAKESTTLHGSFESSFLQSSLKRVANRTPSPGYTQPVMTRRSLRIFCICIICALLAAAPTLSQAGRAQRNPAPSWESSIQSMLKAAGQAGVLAVSLPSGRIVYEYRAGDVFVPASLVKVLTSYAALKNLGPRHQFETVVRATAKPAGDVLPGDIWIKSEGDIFMQCENTAQTLADGLRKLGIRSIRGGVYADNSYFQPETEKIRLDEASQGNHEPVVSATSLQFNSVTFRIGPGPQAGSPLKVDWLPPGDYVQVKNQGVTSARASKAPLRLQSMGVSGDGRESYLLTGKLGVKTKNEREYRFTVNDPAGFVARSFKRILKQAGIDVLGAEAKAGTAPQTAITLASSQSPPLEEILYGLNRYSNNFMAEMLLRDLGARVAGVPGTKEKGIAAVMRSLRELGVPEREVELDSGSGLSRTCRVSPRAFGAVLAKAHEDLAIAAAFMGSLAVNSQDGTLRNRMRSSDSLIRGKTGTLNNVVSFAGYVSAPGKDDYAVVVILNDVHDIHEARKSVDAFLEQVPSLASGEPAAGSR